MGWEWLKYSVPLLTHPCHAIFESERALTCCFYEPFQLNKRCKAYFYIEVDPKVMTTKEGPIFVLKSSAFGPTAVERPKMGGKSVTISYNLGFSCNHTSRQKEVAALSKLQQLKVDCTQESIICSSVYSSSRKFPFYISLFQFPFYKRSLKRLCVCQWWYVFFVQWFMLFVKCPLTHCFWPTTLNPKPLNEP